MEENMPKCKRNKTEQQTLTYMTSSTTRKYNSKNEK